MFLPPEERPPGLPPRGPRPPRREITKREEKVLTWLVGFVVAMLFVAPIGGGTVLQAAWYLMRQH